ncbi:MAG TPA: hypothetical protein VJX72_13920 [Candidatus Acidoferrum sp.]|nr:hypothetical protein [Candidatus Acidoferrum sp.]
MSRLRRHDGLVDRPLLRIQLVDISDQISVTRKLALEEPPSPGG